MTRFFMLLDRMGARDAPVASGHGRHGDADPSPDGPKVGHILSALAPRGDVPEPRHPGPRPRKRIALRRTSVSRQGDAEPGLTSHPPAATRPPSPPSPEALRAAHPEQTAAYRRTVAAGAVAQEDISQRPHARPGGEGGFAAALRTGFGVMLAAGIGVGLFWEPGGEPGAEVPYDAGDFGPGLETPSVAVDRTSIAPEPPRPSAGMPDFATLAEAEADLALQSAAIEDLKAQLVALGYRRGQGEPGLGPKTRADIAQWQASVGLPSTGFLDRPSFAILVSGGR